MSIPAFQPFKGLPSNIPALEELKQRDRWVAWRYETRKDRITKPPLDPNLDDYARTSEPSTWGTYDQAVARAQAKENPGVGFVLNGSENYVGIDLDKCIDDAGRIEPWAEYILMLGETYAEISPSGKGIRMIAKGEINDAIVCAAANVEIYENKRYLTITGNKHPLAPDTINPAPHTIEALIERVREIKPEAVQVQAQQTERTDFIGRVNNLALQNLPLWVPNLLPAATLSSNGAYRVTSEDLGRPNEEDLSISPAGIKDFGVHDMDDPNQGKRTAVGLVLEYGEQPDERSAAFWLCDLLGKQPEELGYATAADEFGVVKYVMATKDLQDEFEKSVGEREQGALTAERVRLGVDDEVSVELTAAQREAIADAVQSKLEKIAAAAAKVALPWSNIRRWAHEPVPEREWAIQDYVPLRQVGVFSGEGGTGKSIIELQKNVAHVLGGDWLGTVPIKGPAFYIGCEDEEDEIHRRLAPIAANYDATFDDLAAGGLHVLSLFGKDATLCVVGRSGLIETTPLYKQIYEAAGDIKPKNISVDTLSRVFSGSEIDRVQVYAFAQHMQALATVANGSVTVLSHPSLSGMASGSGLSGSTAWHGAFRFRQYLTSAKAESGEQPDSDLRELQFKKNQYGPRGEPITLQYRNGLFLPIEGASIETAERAMLAEETFIELLRRYTAQERSASDKQSSTYAPSQFAKEKLAEERWLNKKDFELAMRRLFAANKIKNQTDGPISRRRSRLVIAE